MTIQQEVEIRGITRVLHFTHIDNLPFILDKGILTRDSLTEPPAKFNDDIRLDGHLDATCLSISFPNSKMFYKYRMNRPGDWVILSLDPRILWEKNCSFYKCNAASASVSSLDPATLTGLEAFNEMFYETPEPNTRESNNLKPRHTTDVQAEVLVFSDIDVSYINSVFYTNKKSADDHCGLAQNIKHQYYATITGSGATLFSQRDYCLR